MHPGLSITDTCTGLLLFGLIIGAVGALLEVVAPPRCKPAISMSVAPDSKITSIIQDIRTPNTSHLQSCCNSAQHLWNLSLLVAPDQDASLGMRRAKSLRKKMNEVDTFATARGLPEQLRHALSDYYNDAWMAHEGEQ